MINGLIFDLDDTLYYEKEYVLGAFKEVAHYLESKYKKDGKDLYLRMTQLLEKYGRGKIFNVICKENCFDEDMAELINIYRNSVPKLELYEDSIEILIWARKNGYRLGVITDGCSKVQWNKIQALQIEKFVDKIIVTDDLGKEFWKPNKKSYLDMIEFLKLEKDECIYIGDNPNKDFIGAKGIGIKTIRIIREKGDHISTFLDEKYEADLNVANFFELMKLLENKEF